MDDNEWVTTEQACAFLGIHRTTLWRMVKAGRLVPHRRPGQRMQLFRREDIERLSQPQPAHEEKP
jgi:excisionase family DNA binding protein